MNAARVIFRKGAAPAAAPVMPVSVRIPPAPVVFVKSITPAPVRPEPAPEFDPGFDFGKPMTGHMFDIIVKSLHEGAISVEDAVRARDAWVCFKPLPVDLIDAVLEQSS